MKKIWIIAAISGILYGCGGNSSQMQSTEQNEQSMADIHNAQNALDYEGTYIGELPTANGPSMIISITLQRNTYTLKTDYIGKSSFVVNGTYTWSADGSTIILNGITDAPNQYFVAENTLTQLDIDGNQIVGDFAEMYVLHKVLAD